MAEFYLFSGDPTSMPPTTIYDGGAAADTNSTDTFDGSTADAIGASTIDGGGSLQTTWGGMLSTINRTFEVALTKIVKEHRLASGTLKRDLIAHKRTFTLTWKTLAAADDDVADGGFGADSLEALAMVVGGLTFRRPNVDGTTTDYGVFVTPGDFKQTMALKRANGKQYYDVSMILEEQ